MDLRHLRYFVAVADERHLGRAAARLFLAQPALSRQMQDLEQDLNIVLLDRTPRGADLTPAGAEFAHAARRLLEETAASIERARRAAEGLEGTLVVGVTRTALWRDFTMRAAEAVHVELPHVTLVMEEVEAGRNQWERLRSGSLDLAIGTQPPPLPGLRAEPLFDSSLDCALLAASHPLASKKRLVPADLNEVPLLWATPDLHPALGAAVQDELERLDIRSPGDFTYPGPHSVWMAVAGGSGWSPVPGAMKEWSPDGTVAVPVDGLHVPLVNSIIHRADDARRVVRLVLASFKRYRDRTRPAGRRSSGSSRVAAEALAQPRPATGLELRHLRACAALGRSESLGEAAAGLKLSQPALSRQIRDLEREVGATICERTARGVRLTEAGASLAADATRIIEGVADIEAGMARARRLQAHRVLVSAIEMAGANPVVVRWLRLCNEQNPDLRIEMLESVRPTAFIAALKDGETDLAIGPLEMGDDDDDAVDRLQLTADAISCALLPASHPLAQRAQLAPADLAELPFLVVSPEASPTFHARSMHALAQGGIGVGAVISFDGIQTSWANVAQGRGWALGVGRHRSQPPAGCVAVPVEGLSVPWGLVLLWRRGERIPAIQRIVGIARELSEPGLARRPARRTVSRRGTARQ